MPERWGNMWQVTAKLTIGWEVVRAWRKWQGFICLSFFVSITHQKWSNDQYSPQMVTSPQMCGGVRLRLSPSVYECVTLWMLPWMRTSDTVWMYTIITILREISSIAAHHHPVNHMDSGLLAPHTVPALTYLATPTCNQAIWTPDPHLPSCQIVIVPFCSSTLVSLHTWLPKLSEIVLSFVVFCESLSFPVSWESI